MEGSLTTELVWRTVHTETADCFHLNSSHHYIMGSADSRMCTIEINNQSKIYTLTKPSIYLISGGCQTPLPAQLGPYESGRAVFIKTAGTACGSVGVFTYTISNVTTVRKLAIMFSVPFNYNLYSNWFAAGVFDQQTPCDNNLYEKMYYEKQDGFVRKKASDSGIFYEKDGVIVKAIMTDTNQSILTIDVENK